MAAIKHNIYLPAEHYKDGKNVGTDEINMEYSPYEHNEPYIIVEITTKDDVKVDTHIELCDAVSLRDFLNTVIPTMEKQDRENRG